MAKFKMKKLPRKPKQSASNATLENYLKKVAEVRAHNQAIAREKARHDGLKKRVAAVSGADVQPGRVSSGGTTRKRKSTGGKKKTAKKSTRRRKR